MLPTVYEGPAHSFRVGNAFKDDVVTKTNTNGQTFCFFVF